MSLAGLFKDVFIVLSSSVIFNAPLTTIQIAGYTVSIAGIQFYKEFKADPQVIFKIPGKLFRCQVDIVQWLYSIVVYILGSTGRIVNSNSNNNNNSNSNSHSNSQASTQVNNLNNSWASLLGGGPDKVSDTENEEENSLLSDTTPTGDDAIQVV